MENKIEVINKSMLLGKEIDVYGSVDEPLFKAKRLLISSEAQVRVDMAKPYIRDLKNGQMKQDSKKKFYRTFTIR